MDGRAREVATMHLLCEPLYLAASVDKDHGLRNGKSLVQITERVQLPLLALNHDVELLDTIEGELVTLHKDADRVAHEFGGKLEHIGRHGGREKAHVHGGRELLEHIVNLVLEAARKHFIGLIQHKVVDVIDGERASVDHVEHAARSADDKLHARAELVHVLTHIGATNASHCGDPQVVADGHDNLHDLRGKLTRRRQDESLAVADTQIDVLKQSDREGSGLASS
mmetsp:Transcript_554/g.1859  ORF Transcript_554/g.1859 Transcript_554/m.1859 type:complete len:225 (+) Transcript_554:912-1586(+)